MREIHFDSGKVGDEAHKLVHFESGVTVDKQQILQDPAIKEFMDGAFAEVTGRRNAKAEESQINEVRQRALKGLATIGDVFSLSPKGPK